MNLSGRILIGIVFLNLNLGSPHTSRLSVGPRDISKMRRKNSIMRVTVPYKSRILSNVMVDAEERHLKNFKRFGATCPMLQHAQSCNVLVIHHLWH